MNIEVKIPIKLYLKKFIAKTHCTDPFTITTGRCHFSALILDPIKKDYHKHILKPEEGVYTDLILLVPLNERKFTVDKETVLRINQRLKSMFDQQLTDMVTMTNQKKGNIFESVKIFTSYYDIQEDDLKFETVVKMYYRARFPQDRKQLVKEELDRYKQLDLFAS